MKREGPFKAKNACLLAVCSILLLSFFGRGSVLHITAVLGFNLWIGVPLLILTGAAWVISNLPYSDQGRIHHAARMMLVGVGILSSQLISIPAGQMLLAHEVREAQAYCEALIPTLDGIKEKQGVYPKSQEEIIKEQKDLPRLLRSDRFYWRNGQVFTFSFKDPAGVSNFYEFNSAKRKWERLS
jgi:hypothetical protein